MFRHIISCGGGNSARGAAARFGGKRHRRCGMCAYLRKACSATRATARAAVPYATPYTWPANATTQHAWTPARRRLHWALAQTACAARRSAPSHCALHRPAGIYDCRPHIACLPAAWTTLSARLACALCTGSGRKRRAWLPFLCTYGKEKRRRLPVLLGHFAVAALDKY